MTTIATTTKNQKVLDVIQLVLDGKPLREAIKEIGISPWTFNIALQGDREAAAAYARAVEIKADLLADEVVSLADGDGDPAKVRNQMQARQWLASKLYTKRYGDRVDVNVTQTIDIGSTLAEARARLRPISDQSRTIDLEAIEITEQNIQRPTDKESLAPDIAPDIFS